MARALTLITCCVVALGAAAPAFAGTLDQQQTNIEGPEGEPFGTAFTKGQTFTAGLTGKLDQVDLALENPPGAIIVCTTEPPTITAEVRAVSAGLPTNTVLATKTIPFADLPPTMAFFSIGFDNPPDVLAGTQYAIAVYSSGGMGDCAFAGRAVGPPDPYAGGTAFSQIDSNPAEPFPNTDLAFKTYVVSPAPPPPNCSRQPATIVGTEKADTLIATAGPDVIAALGGKDSVKGLGGDDRICGGKGPDTLRGGGGADRLKGGESSDALKGGGGEDRCTGGPGGDTARKCEIKRSI